MLGNKNVFVPVDNFNSGWGDLDYSIRQRKRKWQRLWWLRQVSALDKAPRLSIRKDIWILLSDTVSSTNSLQIVRRQCCLNRMGWQMKIIQIFAEALRTSLAQWLWQRRTEYQTVFSKLRSDVLLLWSPAVIFPPSPFKPRLDNSYPSLLPNWCQYQSVFSN